MGRQARKPSIGRRKEEVLRAAMTHPSP